MAAPFVQRGKKIVAIGRNYLDHINELNNALPKEPFFFLKPTTSYVQDRPIEVPKGVVVHHEVELGVVIGKSGRDIHQVHADSHISGYALAIDMTARNMQDVVKKQGLPWSAVKGFDTFTPVGPFIPRSSIPDPYNLRLWLKINGRYKQNGTTADMIFKIPRLIEHVSSIMTLEEGDLLLTGTPSGVGPVVVGDEITAGLHSGGSADPLATIRHLVVQREGGYVFNANKSN